MMVGVPGETDEDIDVLIRFSTELGKIVPVTGIAPFVPKRNTPLDVAGFAGIRTVEQRLKYLSRGLKGRVEVRPTSARWDGSRQRWRRVAGARRGCSRAVSAGGKFSAYKRAFQAVDPSSRAPWRGVAD